MSSTLFSLRLGALGCLLSAGLAPAFAAEQGLKAVDVGQGRRMWVDARDAGPAPGPAATDTVWVNGQAVRVLREPTALPAAGARTAADANPAVPAAAAASTSRAAPPAGAEAVTLSDGSKMWVLRQR